MAEAKKQVVNAKPEVLAESEFNKAWERENEFEQIRKSNDPRFGEILVYKQMWNGDIVFSKEKNVSNKNEATNDIKELKNRMALNHEGLQVLNNYSTTVKKELCSTHYISRGIYNFPHSDLSKEISDRKKNNTDFSHSELSHLAYQILEGLQFLHGKGIVHGDVKPLFIGINKSQNSYHLLDRLANPSPLEKLQAGNIINKKELYVSPQLFQKLQGKDKTYKYSPQKNDLFALGLSILQAGTGKNIQDIYLPNGEFNLQKLNEYKAEFNAKYQPQSGLLVDIEKDLLEYNDDQQLEAAQILAKFPKYAEYKKNEGLGLNYKSKVVVNSTPQQRIEYVSPIETHYIQPTETKVTYGEPVIKTYVYNQPPPGYNLNQAVSYINYNNPNTVEVRAEPVSFEGKEVRYVQQAPGNIVYQQPINTSYEPIIRRSVSREPIRNPVYVNSNQEGVIYQAPLDGGVQYSYPVNQPVYTSFEPIVRRSIQREATIFNPVNTEVKPQGQVIVQPGPIETKYTINEKGEVVQNDKL